jgi:hypothetical protein
MDAVLLTDNPNDHDANWPTDYPMVINSVNDGIAIPIGGLCALTLVAAQALNRSNWRAYEQTAFFNMRIAAATALPVQNRCALLPPLAINESNNSDPGET